MHASECTIWILSCILIQVFGGHTREVHAFVPIPCMMGNKPNYLFGFIRNNIPKVCPFVFFDRSFCLLHILAFDKLENCKSDIERCGQEDKENTVAQCCHRLAYCDPLSALDSQTTPHRSRNCVGSC